MDLTGSVVTAMLPVNTSHVTLPVRGFAALGRFTAELEEVTGSSGATM